MFTKWIKEQFLIEQIQRVLVLVRFDYLYCETASHSQSQLHINFRVRCLSNIC